MFYLRVRPSLFVRECARDFVRVRLVRSQTQKRREILSVAKSDSCGVRTHALADWRLKPAP